MITLRRVMYEYVVAVVYRGSLPSMSIVAARSPTEAAQLVTADTLDQVESIVVRERASDTERLGLVGPAWGFTPKWTLVPTGD